MRLMYLFTVVSLLTVSQSVFAEPPSWAPAHGWRGHHRHHDDMDDYAVYDGYYYQPQPLIVEQPSPVLMPGYLSSEAQPVFQNEEGQYCREYQAQVKVGGSARSSYGTACLQPDGQWRIVN